MITANPWYNLILYQIYPRSFKDSNNDGIGDLQGIIEKLDYLVDLGINAVWISPIFPSPMADFGYDISDYCDIDPIFGNLKDFDILVKEAHKRNIKIFLDYVLNHTSDKHPWFLESRSSKNSKKRDWYIWHDPVDGHEPNNWMSVFEKSAWTFDKATGQYYFNSFLSAQPDLNWGNPEVVEAMCNVLRFWFDRGVDGFRMDVVNFIWKQKHYKDEPINPNYIEGKMEPFLQLSHIYSKDQDEVFTIIDKLSKVAQEYEDKFLISEVSVDERGIDSIVTYKKYYDRLNSNITVPFNFEFIFMPWDAKGYRSFVDAYLQALDNKHMPIFVLGNHDRSRIVSRIGIAQARVAVMLLLTLPGMPIIYNGEELGMHDVSIPSSRIQDPYALRYPLFGRDPQRTPMQWNSSKNAGFTKDNPWLPLSADYKEINSDKEMQDKTSMLSLYKTLIQFRKLSSPILKGKYSSLELGSQFAYGYIREFKDEKILVLLNFSDKKQLVKLPIKGAKLLFNSFLDQQSNKEIDLSHFTLRPNEGCIFSI